MSRHADFDYDTEHVSRGHTEYVHNDPFAAAEPCGYCGTAIDPETICQRCFDAVHRERDIPTGDHWHG